MIYLRYKLKISVGDGGNKNMQALLHARSNIVDYVPLALIMMFLLEYWNTPPVILHTLGIGIIASRFLQGLALSASSGASFGRILGALLMHAVMLTNVILLIAKYLLLNNYI